MLKAALLAALYGFSAAEVEMDYGGDGVWLIYKWLVGYI